MTPLTQQDLINIARDAGVSAHQAQALRWHELCGARLQHSRTLCAGRALVAVGRRGVARGPRL